MSVSTFQRLFLALCGITIGEYICLRKLTLAGKNKWIDMKMFLIPNEYEIITI